MCSTALTLNKFYSVVAYFYLLAYFILIFLCLLYGFVFLVYLVLKSFYVKYFELLYKGATVYSWICFAFSKDVIVIDLLISLLQRSLFISQNVELFLNRLALYPPFSLSYFFLTQPSPLTVC